MHGGDFFRIGPIRKCVWLPCCCFSKLPIRTISVHTQLEADNNITVTESADPKVCFLQILA